MKNYHYTLLSFISLILCSCGYNPYKEWLPAELPNYEIENLKLPDYVAKEVGNITYTVHSSWDAAERKALIADTRKWINECAKIINESPFNDSLNVFAARNREEMKSGFGMPLAGASMINDSFFKGKCIFCIYTYKGEYHPLKHELMHMVVGSKWGNKGVPQWLSEGIAVFACPESISCDGLTLEEKYAYLLQTGKSLTIKELTDFSFDREIKPFKAAYAQSGYLVGYLLKNFGAEKLKKLWITGAEQCEKSDKELVQRIKEANVDLYSEEAAKMRDAHSHVGVYLQVFKEVYGLEFETMTDRISRELTKKYPHAIPMDWEEFGKDCIE